MKMNPNQASEYPAEATGMTKDQWHALMESQGHTRFRADQILEWIYRKRVTDFSEMTNLGQPVREWLSEQFCLQPLESVMVSGSRDTTQKFLFRLADDRLIETVLIPASQSFFGERSERKTVCVSSQVGCAYDCKFCASGLAGFTRNLSAGEIVSQVLQVEEDGDKVQNIVFMGMGEPLANLRNLTTALEILNSHWGVCIGARRITVSTSGLAPQIEKLAQLPIPIRLAISLHGATDEVRNQIMPVNRKYPLDRLFAALDTWKESKKQKVTFEYILIEGVNDALEQAEILASRTRATRAKVNLIPYNKVEGLQWNRPDKKRQQDFLKVLKDAGVPATLRTEKGHDINAACGQLRLQKETERGTIAPVL